jgi:hypothetical protein
MGDVVNLRNTPIDLTSDVGRAFTVDCTRAGEGLISDKELADIYELSPADWRAITKDKSLGNAIRAERERRVRNGTAVREAAAKHLVKGPGILDGIMSGADSNPRAKIEAFKELRAAAAVGSVDRPNESERFLIRIDLTAGGGEVETFDKELKIHVSTADGPITLEGKSDGGE